MERTQIEINLPAELKNGVYANSVMLSYSLIDFTLDFIHMIPNDKPVIRARILMAPQMFKSTVESLTKQLRDWEETNGVIEMPIITPAISGPVAIA